MHISALLYGIALGFMLCLTLGTVFFALIQNSIEYGYNTGIYIALGVIFSDSILISVAITGSEQLPEIPHLKTYASILCILLLMAMGISNILKKPSIEYTTKGKGGITFFIITGFLLNILNPANFFVWAATATKLRNENNYEMNQLISFFVGCLISIFITEIGISFFAFKLRAILTPTKLQNINRITGIIYVFFALLLLSQILI